MNKRQKEVIQSNLDAEKAVLKQLERHYRSALNDIDMKLRIMQSDELTVSRLYRIEHQKALKAQVEAILEKLHSDEYTTISQFLNEAYTDAFVGTAYDMFGQGVPLILPIDPKEAVKAIQTDSKISEDLYTALGVDTEKLKTSVASEITRGLASDMAYDDIARNIRNASKAPLSRAKTIVATEAHRIQEASTYDAQKKAKSKGADIVRQWNSTMDGNTRPTHRHLDGQIREMDEPFEMDGKSAMYPGDFGDPAEDCNCRCVTLQRARWALGESELETLKQRAEFFGLDKTKSFEDFKEKYLNSSKTIEKYEESGIIKTDNIVRAARVEANGRFVNSNEKLYKYAAKIVPIEGYADFTCHADPDKFYIDMQGNGNSKDFVELSVEEFAEAIRNSNSYSGGNIRVISCQAGAKEDGVAQRLANELNVSIYAPTEIVNIDEDGNMFVSDNEILADIWYHASVEERTKIKETGEWKLFEPQKG